jgi:hypothetical protein
VKSVGLPHQRDGVLLLTWRYNGERRPSCAARLAAEAAWTEHTQPADPHSHGKRKRRIHHKRRADDLQRARGATLEESGHIL